MTHAGSRTPRTLTGRGLVPVRGGDDAWEITRAGVGAHCAGRSSEAIWLSDEQAAPAQLLAA